MTEIEKKTSLWKRLQNKLTFDEMFHETEVQANHLGAVILFCSGIILAVILILDITGVFPIAQETIFPPAIQGIVEIAILLLICKLTRNDAWWLKYILTFGLVIVYARLDSMLTHKAAILMVLPVVFSSRYFSRKLTNVTAILVSVIFALSCIWGATHGMINLNIVTMPKGINMTTTGGFLGTTVENAGVTADMLIRNSLLYDYLPKWLMFSVAAIISSNIARRGREMVIQQYEKAQQSARIESELNLATRIQAAMLPNIFPAFPEREDFDIYASMTPAKEVGGDFYDFFLIDENHLGLVMADVSGKGVPAALFMMACKIILKNYAMNQKTPAEILSEVNEQICKNNPEDMFVTAWLGVLDLRTHIMTASNAGHLYPVLKKPDGPFELLKDRHGFVLGGMNGIRYQEYQIPTAPGTKLFLYTDGVTEAANADHELYTEVRLLDALNRSASQSPQEILACVGEDVRTFVGEAEQFDDLTMMCLHYIGENKS
ncbi:MAG: PP2C family protein-serine/threonine phosphatase [Clostridia bacterium]|nr:PP2C family protein-serine/threonine phosphatase [Clostridia bacterium]